MCHAQQYRCDQYNHQALNYLVKGHHLYIGERGIKGSG